MTSLWERIEQTAARPALSAQTIARTGIAIADAEGLDAVTMRRLATELGVTPMAAYRHVSSRDDVLELMVDLAYQEIEIPDGDGWRDTMQALATSIRALMLAHRWLTRLTAPQIVYELTPNRLAVQEQALATLHNLSFDADTAMTVYRTVIAYVSGATSAEIGLGDLMSQRGWTSGAETREGLSGQMTWLLSTGRYPAFARYIHEAAHKDDYESQFQTGLQCVLDGIAARINQTDGLTM